MRSRGFRDILIARFTFPAAKTEFTCVLVNQQIDYERDQELEKEFAGQSGMAKKQIVIDSDYNVSYPGNELGDDSKNSFDKLFLKWSNGEVDAIVMTDDFLEYCVSVGGEFYDAGKFRTGDLSVCRMVLLTLGNGVGSGIILDGEIYEGRGGSGCELGHMVIVEDGEPCR